MRQDENNTRNYFTLGTEDPHALHDFVCTQPRLPILIRPMKSLRQILPALLCLMTGLHSLALDENRMISSTVIPALVIKEATITDAVRITLAEARKINPGVSSINVILHEAPASTARVTLDLKKVPLLSALHMTAETCFYTLTIKNNTIELHPMRPGTEESGSILVHLSPDTLRQLTIDKIDEASFKSALQRLKIDLQEIDKIIPIPDQNSFFIQGRESELSKVSSIIALLDRGLRIQKRTE